MNDAAQAIPPRYWWLKRILLASGGFLLLLISLRVWWGWEAHRRLQAEIDRIIAAGEPIYPEDFDPKEQIPDDQNAVRLILDAYTAVNITTDQGKLLDELSFVPCRSERQQQVAAILEANRSALELVRRARGLPGADWGSRFRSPVTQPNFFALWSENYQLSRILFLATMDAVCRADHAQALEIIQDQLVYARVLRASSTLAQQLSASSTHGYALRGLEHILPKLGASNGAAPTDPRWADTAKGLIRDLLDEEDLSHGVVRSLFVQRMIAWDWYRGVANGDLSWTTLFVGGPMPASRGDAVWGRAARPLIDLEGLSDLRTLTAHLAAIRKPNYASATPVLREPKEKLELLHALAHPFSSYDGNWTSKRVRDGYFGTLAMRRLAAIAIAIRLYELEHGHRPGTLDELVGHALAQIPPDPHAADGRPFGYLPDADPAILYSVGEDGKDDGGRFEVAGGGVSRRVLDLPFFLDGKRPYPRADDEPDSTQTGEDDEDKEEGGGEGDEKEEGEKQP